MRYTELGTTGITVSEYCLGTMMFGAMGNTDHDDCIKIIHKAIDAGVTFIDTAGFYAGGETETIVGKALQGRRGNVVLSTKFSASKRGDNLASGGSKQLIIKEVENSLRRLNTDHLDVVQISRFDENTDLQETVSVLSDLVQQGKIGVFGSSMFSADRIVEGQWIAERHDLLRFRCEQLLYSIFSREIELYVLPTFQRYSIGVLTFGPLDGGWLTGRYLTAMDLQKEGRATRSWGGGEFDPHSELVQRKLRLARVLDGIAKQAGLKFSHLSVAFTRAHPAVSSTIIGPRTHAQLDDALACADLRLSDDILDQIDASIAPGFSVNGLNATAIPKSIDVANRRRCIDA